MELTGRHVITFTPVQEAEYRAMLARNRDCPLCGKPAANVVGSRLARVPEVYTFCDDCGVNRSKAK